MSLYVYLHTYIHLYVFVYFYFLCEGKNSLKNNSPKEHAGNLDIDHIQEDISQNVLENLETGHIKEKMI